MLKSALKKIIPPALLAEARRLKEGRPLADLHRDWRAAIGRAIPHEAARPTRRLLIVPSDAQTLIGALGDDAMISTAMSMGRAACPDVEIDVLTATPRAQEAARALGLNPVSIWAGGDYVARLFDHLSAAAYDAVLLLGADVMDGYYSALTSTKLIVTADLASRFGARVAFLGFSFNDRPAAALKPFFDGVGPGVRFNVRDAISLSRFEAFTTARGRLVADSAFLLQPATDDDKARATLDWIAAQKAQGRTVVGLNVHPMLYASPRREDLDRMIAVSVAALEGADPAIAWLVLPHDYRAERGDAAILRPIHDRLSDAVKARTFYLEGTHSAAVLKAVAGAMDGVVAGRMHLAVASLGRGVPVLALTYQGKFDGLFRLAGLPEWLLLSPDQAFVEARLSQVLARFLSELPALKASVGAHLPDLRAASALNYDVL